MIDFEIDQKLFYFLRVHYHSLRHMTTIYLADELNEDYNEVFDAIRRMLGIGWIESHPELPGWRYLSPDRFSELTEEEIRYLNYQRGLTFLPVRLEKPLRSPYSQTKHQGF